VFFSGHNHFFTAHAYGHWLITDFLLDSQIVLPGDEPCADGEQDVSDAEAEGDVADGYESPEPAQLATSASQGVS
jgi:hypothetical protein